MFKKKETTAEPAAEYPLSWPTSQRWNPQYNVPRNSADDGHWSEPGFPQLECGVEPPIRPTTTRTSTFGRSKRDMDTRNARTAKKQGVHVTTSPDSDGEEEEELTNLTHWLETLSELYMNNLDNRARWDPRWLNVTRRERFEGMASVHVTIVDYLKDDSVKRSDPITTKNQMADALQARPDNSEVRVIMVSDVSRFVMGALGQTLSIEPEFWYEHLVNSGYAASDSGLKVKNAVWMNWAERETRFRHHATPGPGQRTEWNVPRRTLHRQWTHVRWARLGLLNYLGRKGFHEDEIEMSLRNGRWMMEHDVQLDKHGLLMTEKRRAQAEKIQRKKKKKEKKKGKNGTDLSTEDLAAGSRFKTSNVYRAYSTFDGLPKNPTSWKNRDLRVLAPEGASYWPGVDSNGKKIVVLVFDPQRSMKNQGTKEVTPSLTFMPRPLELEAYSDEDWWRTADPDETYLDPPPRLPSKAEIKEKKKAALKQNLHDKKEKLQSKLKSTDVEEEANVSDTDSTDTDSEYDEEYEDELRQDYANPRPYNRDRDYARKYALSTHDLFYRHMSTITASQLLENSSLIPSILTHLLLDDLWGLLAEIRLELDHLDSDIGGDLYEQLLEFGGNTTRQNLNWLRSILQELGEWTGHVSASSTVLSHSEDVLFEIKTLFEDLESLQSRAANTLSLLSTTIGLAQSSSVIDQTSGINKLTELAFFFVPISFITSVFSMQVNELISRPPPLWSWGIALSTVVLTTYLLRIMLRSPSVRIMALHCRATILNRFTSSKAGSASHRMNTIGNRAIIKFVLFALAVFGLLIGLITVILLGAMLLFGGIWLGAIAAALYFIVTRWPDPAVLAPCFVMIAVALGGMWVTWFFSHEIEEVASTWTDRSAEWIVRVFPSRWTLDRVDDSDLAQEGVNTYARQAIVLAT